MWTSCLESSLRKFPSIAVPACVGPVLICQTAFFLLNELFKMIFVVSVCCWWIISTLDVWINAGFIFISERRFWSHRSASCSSLSLSQGSLETFEIAPLLLHTSFVREVFIDIIPLCVTLHKCTLFFWLCRRFSFYWQLDPFSSDGFLLEAGVEAALSLLTLYSKEYPWALKMFKHHLL